MTLLLPAFTGAPEVGKVYHTDLFTLCDAMPDASVDMVLQDLPYGTTACHWDTVIPFEPMWARLKRIIKPRGAIVLTASQPFTSALVMSNPGMFRYEWVWDKKLSTRFLDANTRPLLRHENTLIFSVEGATNYYPVMRAGLFRKKGGINRQAAQYGSYHDHISWNDEYFPTSIIEIGNTDRTHTLHPTQKPVALFEYLIRTYTREGELVFDGVVGSGTTAVAARNCKRNFICGDKELDYVLIARDRLRLPFEAKHKPQENDMAGLPLFAAQE